MNDLIMQRAKQNAIKDCKRMIHKLIEHFEFMHSNLRSDIDDSESCCID